MSANSQASDLEDAVANSDDDNDNDSSDNSETNVSMDDCKRPSVERIDSIQGKGNNDSQLEEITEQDEL